MSKRYLIPLLFATFTCCAAAEPVQVNPTPVTASTLTVTSKSGIPVADDKYPDLKIEISAPDGAVEFGELVDLQAKIPGEKPQNLYSINFNWTIIPPPTNTVVWPDKSRVLFGTGVKSKKVTAILTASYVYVVKTENAITDVIQKQTTVMRTVDIGPPAPEPGPGPEPNPGPGPGPGPNPQPNGSGMADYVTGIKSLVQGDAALRTTTAKAIAQAYRANTAAIAAGAYKDNGSKEDRDAKMSQIVVDMRAANRLAITSTGSTIENWQPFFQQLADKMGQLSKTGYDTQPKIGELWLEIATALEKY